jgi:hypothetical protein
VACFLVIADAHLLTGVHPDGIPKKFPKLCQNALDKKIATILYRRNLTIFSKNKSVTSFKTLQNGCGSGQKFIII